jgi:hypothetical protein
MNTCQAIETPIMEQEAMEGVKFYMGKPSFIHKGMSIWLLTGNKGFIQSGCDLLPFVVDLENQIFDVWYDGCFIDHGEELYDAYATYCMELELLK